MATGHSQTHGEELVTRVDHEHAPPDRYLMPEFPPNFATMYEAIAGQTITGHAIEIHPGKRPHLGHSWFVTPAFSILYAILIIAAIRWVLRRASMERPDRRQMAVEMLMGGLRNFFGGIMGREIADKYLPFLGSLWIFILVNNLGVLVPGMKSPTYSWKLTFALALVTFCYVQYQAIRAAGFWGWFKHLMGEPLWLAPLQFPLHVLGEIIKPISLALRLFGNIFGEDKLLATFLGMGMLLVGGVFGTATPFVGIPFALPFYFLVLLLSIVQATVFALLASIYIMLLLPHDEHEEHGGTPHVPTVGAPSSLATPSAH